MSERFEMRLSKDLADRIDEARGDLPRATWIKRALEKALATSAGTGEDGRVSPARVPASPRTPHARSSADAKAGVKPILKAGR